MATRQDNKPYEYFAFISYKREDEKWAKWLQHKLEYYKLPSSVRKDNPDLPGKIRPVFKDTTDLEPGVLTQKIQIALNSSKFLIVICSPRSANSVWVSKEVQSFIDSGRADHIIPFIIGGTPNALNPKEECYPEGLRQLAGEKELLGANINEMGRDAAAIKVVARMFNLRFDTLWQRFKRYKRIRTFISIIVVSLLLFMSVIIALVLWSKNKTIDEQNVRLTQLVNNLQEENRTISQMRNIDEQYSYAGTLQGNDAEAWLIHTDFHPYEPIIAFSDDWGTWLHYINSNKEILMPFKGDEWETVDIEGISFSDDGSELMMSSMGGTYIWDVDDCVLTKYISRDNDDIRDSLVNSKYVNFNLISEPIDIDELNTFSKYDFKYQNNILTVSWHNSSKSTQISASSGNERDITVLKNPKYNEYLFIGDNRAALFEEESNGFTQYFKGYDSYDFKYSSNGHFLLIGKDIFRRKLAQTDTITVTSYKKSSFPITISNNLNNYNITHIKSINGEFVKYFYKGVKRSIHVLKPSSSGNGQEYLSDVLFCNQNKIVCIIEHGDHRVYNASTGELVGKLDNYVWDENPLGYEEKLGHWNSYIIHAQNIDRDLYTVSSGGVIRIYNIDNLKLERIIELPLENCALDEPQLHIDSCEISMIDETVRFKFAHHNQFYKCSLQKKNK